ncbi:AAA family ATPase [Bacillus cereus]|nr:AAA family ATPase [Bacillus cereus]
MQSIVIKNFRSIKDESVSNIQNALLLVGKNNSGKSAI